MIWTAALGQERVPPVLFVRQNSSVYSVAFAAVARLPDLSSLERRQLHVALDLIAQGSIEYSPLSVRQLTQGRLIHSKLLPDGASISFTVPLGSEKAGESLLISLLKDPAFDSQSIPVSLNTLRSHQQDPWSSQVNPQPTAPTTVTREQLLHVFHKVFALANLEAGCVVATHKPELEKLWDSATKDWPTAPEEFPQDESADRPPEIAKGSIVVKQFSAPAVGSNDARFIPTLMALYALGAGKTSSLFRIARQQNGWTYRQETLLWPDAGGWVPRVLFALSPDSELESKCQKLRAELVADIDTWDGDTLLCAQGMAEAQLLRQISLGPLKWGLDPIPNQEEPLLAMDLYWHIKTGRHFNPNELLTQLKAVDLGSMQAAARQILTPQKTATPTRLPAGGRTH